MVEVDHVRADPGQQLWEPPAVQLGVEEGLVEPVEAVGPRLDPELAGVVRADPDRRAGRQPGQVVGLPRLDPGEEGRLQPGRPPGGGVQLVGLDLRPERADGRVAVADVQDAHGATGQGTRATELPEAIPVGGAADDRPGRNGYPSFSVPAPAPAIGFRPPVPAPAAGRPHPANRLGGARVAVKALNQNARPTSSSAPRVSGGSSSSTTAARARSRWHQGGQMPQPGRPCGGLPRGGWPRYRYRDGVVPGTDTVSPTDPGGSSAAVVAVRRGRPTGCPSAHWNTRPRRCRGTSMVRVLGGHPPG